MNIENRKYQFIQKFIALQDEEKISRLEEVMDDSDQDFDIPDNHRLIVEKRLSSYKSVEVELIDWQGVVDDL
jgi:hypothetical protein